MKTEKNILKLSAIGGLFFAVLGLAWGIIIKSDMIMFDGLYSLISLFLSILVMYVASYIQKVDFDKFPFGKGVLEPLTVAFHSTVLIVMCSITLIDGLKQLVSGGNPVNAGLALGYSIISSVGCAIVYFILNKKGKKIESDILKAESNQWLMDTVLSIAVLIAFIVCLVMEKTSFSYLIIYIDPLMVVITSIIFLKVPIRTLIKSFKEVVNSKADEEINDKIYTIVKNIESEYNFEESVTRVSKIGRELRIEIDFVFNEESSLSELREMDEVREEVYNNMKCLKFDKWLNVNFTADKKWAI